MNRKGFRTIIVETNYSPDIRQEALENLVTERLNEIEETEGRIISALTKLSTETDPEHGKIRATMVVVIVPR